MIITNEVLKEIALEADRLIDGMLDEFEDGHFYDVEIKFTNEDGNEFKLKHDVDN